jgi:hypothetical protein
VHLLTLQTLGFCELRGKRSGSDSMFSDHQFPPAVRCGGITL